MVGSYLRGKSEAQLGHTQIPLRTTSSLIEDQRLLSNRERIVRPRKTSVIKVTWVGNDPPLKRANVAITTIVHRTSSHHKLYLPLSSKNCVNMHKQSSLITIGKKCPGWYAFISTEVQLKGFYAMLNIVQNVQCRRTS